MRLSCKDSGEFPETRRSGTRDISSLYPGKLGQGCVFLYGASCLNKKNDLVSSSLYFFVLQVEALSDGGAGPIPNGFGGRLVA